MPAEKYHKAYLENQFPIELREHLQADNLDPTRLPSYDYLNAKGFETRGLSAAVKRYFGEEMTLHEFLRQQGFGHQDDGDWPTTHNETIQHLNGYRESRRNRNEDREATISTLESAMREVLRIVQDKYGTDNLLRFARYEAEEERYRQNEQVEAVLDELKSNKSDGAAKNYIRYFKKFYGYAAPRTRIDQNPVKQVEGQYDFDTRPERDSQPLTDEQVRKLWETLKQLPDRQELSDAVANLTSRHGLREWQVLMMVLLTLGVGVGPRSKEYIRTDCSEHWVFEDDTYIEFPRRKNLPGQVPILVNPEFLEAFRDYMETTRSDWNGKPFPSPNTDSGSRSKSTLNNWLEALCNEAGIRLDDGSFPTLQNLRQTWHNQYHEVLRKNNVQLQLVADEAGTQDENQVKISYRTDEEERRTIRELARRDFGELLPLDELPEVMSDTLDEAEYIDKQTSLVDF